MEAFESFVALAMEAEGLVVSGAVKFPVKLATAKTAYTESQTHGFEVDLVAARADKLVLATVKSFFGSRGVAAEHVSGETPNAPSRRLYALVNNPIVRDAVIAEACARYGYAMQQVELRLYVGKFAGGKSGQHEQRIRDWCGRQIVGGGPIQVVGLREVAISARRVAESKTYRDNSALVAIKVLEAARMLTPMSDV